MKTEEPIVIARYDMSKAFEEEVSFMLDYTEEHADTFSEHGNDEIRILVEKHLPDDPEEFNRWIIELKLDVELREYAEKIVQDWDYGVDEHDCCLQAIDRWLHEVKGPFIAIKLNHECRNLTGHKMMAKDIDSGIFWENLTPINQELTFYMKGYATYAKIKVYHHNFPAGEIIYVRPIEDYIRNNMTYHEMLKIIQEQKQELIYWKTYPKIFNKDTVLQCIAIIIDERMIPWEWPKEWFFKEQL